MIIRFALLVLSVLAAAYFVPGIVVSGLYPAIMVAVLFVVASFTIKPILTILTLPIHFLTLGLSSFLINALIFWFLSTFIQGFTVEGVLAAVLGALIIAIGNAIGSSLS